MQGILDSATQVDFDPTKTGASTLDSAGYEANEIQLDESKDTVAGRIDGIIAKNSPLMQSARTRSAQESNRRGLLNSAMAVSAGEKAVYDSALPIAQQDAATSYDASKTNAGFINQARQQTTQGAQQLQQIGAQAAATTASQKELQEQQRQIQLELQTADGAIREQLLAKQGEIDAQLQATQGDINSRLQSEQGQIDIERIGAQGDVEERITRVQGEINQELQNNQGDQDRQLQVLRNAGAIELADVEYQWRNVLQANQSAAYFFAENSTAIGSILANNEIPLAQKQQLIEQQKAIISAGLSVIGGTSNLNLAGLLDFGGGSSGSLEQYLPGGPLNPSAPPTAWDGNIDKIRAQIGNINF